MARRVPLTVDGVIDSYLPARWRAPRRAGHSIRYWVIHAAITSEHGEVAEAVARYFQTVDRYASTHLAGDNNSVVRCVPDEQRCYGAGGVNDTGIHYELPGQASQSRAQWLDPYSKAALGKMAQVFSLYHSCYGIPAVALTTDQLRAGTSKGVITHAQAVAVFGGSHWDPGPAFPMDECISMMRQEIRMDGASGQPFDEWWRTWNRAPEDVYVAEVEFIQRGLRSLGFYGDGWRIDGLKGPISMAAWRNFERDQGWENANRDAGPRAWNRFIRKLGLR